MNTTDELFRVLQARVSAFQTLYDKFTMEEKAFVVRDLTDLLQDFLENAKIEERIKMQQEATARRYRVKQ